MIATCGYNSQFSAPVKAPMHRILTFLNLATTCGCTKKGIQQNMLHKKSS